MTFDLIQASVSVLVSYCFFRAGQNYERGRASEAACKSCYKKGVSRGIKMGIETVVKQMRAAGADVEVQMIQTDEDTPPGEGFVKVEAEEFEGK